MASVLPNSQTPVKSNFAHLALAALCQTGKLLPMIEQPAAPNRIRELRESREMTIEHLADATGLSVSYVWRLENGERNLSVKNINLFSSALGVEPAELLTPATRKTRTVNVMGKIGAGAEITHFDEQIPSDGLYEIETPFPIPDDAIAFEVEGNSQWPRYDSGDIIIVWRQGVVPEEVVGWEAAVKTSTGHRYLKRVLHGAEPGTYDLESYNAPPIRGVRLEWVAAIQSVIRSGQWRKLSASGRKRLVARMMKVS